MGQRRLTDQDGNSFKIRHFVFGALTGAAIVAAVISYMTRPRGGGAEDGEATVLDADGVSSAVEEPDSSLTASVKPSFDVVRISRGGTGVVAGRAAPNSTVEIYADEKLIGDTISDGRGNWVIIIDTPLASGPAQLTLKSYLPGAEPSSSDDVVVIAVPSRADENFVDGGTEGVVALLTSRDGSGASRILQRPGQSTMNGDGPSLSFDALDYDSEGEAIFQGHADPRSDIAIYLDNAFLGHTRSGDDGRWRFTPDVALAPGAHLLRVDQIIEDARVQLRIEQAFETGQPINSRLREGKVIVQKGNSLWRIARRLYGSGFRYTLIFRENAQEIRDPDLIYPGQILSLPPATESSTENSGKN